MGEGGVAGQPVVRDPQARRGGSAMFSSPHCAHLIEVARRVVRHLPDTDVRAAVLYGSVAWGDADEASDLDIMLLLDRPMGYREVTRVRLADLFGHPLPNGPVFADLDRLAVA